MRKVAPFLLVFLPLLAAAQQPGTADDYPQLLSEWKSAWNDGTGHTTSEYSAWIDRFWTFALEHDNSQPGMKAARKALALSDEANMHRKRKAMWEEASIHSDIMVALLPYVPSLFFQKEVAVWKRLSEQSTNKTVQKVALVQHASHYHFFSLYHEAEQVLKRLEADYQVSPKRVAQLLEDQTLEQIRRDVSRLAPGNPVPDFQLKTLAGRSISPDQQEGKVTFLYFYGSGCGSCVKTYPILNQLHQRYEDEGFLLLGISADKQWMTPKDFQSFLSEYNIEWPQTWAYSKLAEVFNVNAYSIGILINRSGQIVHVSRSAEVLDATPELEGKNLQAALQVLMGA